MTAATSPDNASSSAPWRYWVYALLIAISVGTLLGRMAHVQADHGRTPFLSANDRSRWSTIRALVDEGTFVLDDVILRPDGRRNKDWYTIDLVRHRGQDGKEHYYSSKPPLLTVLLAGEYWLVKNFTGSKLADKPFYVGRLMLVATNIPLFLLYLGMMIAVVERFGRTDLARVFVVAAAAFGTAITPFSVTLSNHLPAAVAGLATLVLVLRITREEKPAVGWFILAGLCATFTVVCELPALSIFPLAGLALLWRSVAKTLLAATPAAGMVFAAALGTNYLAHGTFEPAYSMRKDGKPRGAVEINAAAEAERPQLSAELRASLAEQSGHETFSEQTIIYSGGTERWIVFDEVTQRRLALVPMQPDIPPTADGKRWWRIRQWGNWYDYPGSYWITERTGVDKGEPSRGNYLFQFLLGHHGLLSLTPLWFLTLLGCWFACRDRNALFWIAVVAACLFVICAAFYVARPQIDRNYGGVSCTFRWLLWQIPLWLVLILPAADRLLKSRWGCILCAVLLAASVFSAEYNALNPWTPPWIYDYWKQLGWVVP